MDDDHTNICTMKHTPKPSGGASAPSVPYCISVLNRRARSAVRVRSVAADAGGFFLLQFFSRQSNNTILVALVCGQVVLNVL